MITMAFRFFLCPTTYQKLLILYYQLPLEDSSHFQKDHKNSVGGNVF